ncbi:MAG: hypothetical protein ACOYLE_06865 [Bacteroidales bacterium]
MLDEDEYQKAHLLYGKGMKNSGVSLSNRRERFKELLDYYFEVTGFQETEPNAIMHHRIEQYGPLCENCGKPYRTKQATFCAACGHKRN